MLNRYRIETEDSINYCITWVLALHIADDWIES